MSGIYTPDFKLTIGSVDFSEAPLRNRVNEITVETLSDGASSFKIVLDDSDDRFSAGDTALQEGMECVVQMGFVETEIVQVIKGYVTGVKPKLPQDVHSDGFRWLVEADSRSQTSFVGKHQRFRYRDADRPRM